MNAPLSKRIHGPVIRLHPADKVVVARTPVPAGVSVSEEGFTTRDEIPAGYKVLPRETSARASRS